MRSHLPRFALACALAVAATPSTALAQRCLGTDTADDDAGRRWCGTTLVTTMLDGVTPIGGPAGFGASGQCLSPNDDGSGRAIDITPYFSGGLRFFTTTHTRIVVNTNGNITFGESLSTFTPDPFPVADQPMIAPFWADVDIRNVPPSFTCMGSIGAGCDPCEPCHNPSENGAWWHFEPGRAVFTWDRVGYYNCQRDRRMSFQLILTEAEGCGGEGDFDVEFRFNRCEWETGGASGGSGGFGGTPAQAGFDAGNGMDFTMIPGSRTANFTRTLCNDSNVGEPGIWRYQIRRGTIMCPEAGMPCDTMMMGACGAGTISCDCSGASCTTTCVPQVPSSPERCDAIDNDCDGTPDDGDGLCPSPTQVCDRGVCVEGCFEGGCNEGLTCDGRLCVETACVGVECPAGQRCRGGMCVDACSGVECPADQVCRAGRCVNACEGIMCDDCTTCDGGACVTRCTLGGTCDAGETCTADGRCVPMGCDGVSCGPGTHCEGGTCVDSCIGAVCPEGQMCTGGMCVAMERPDAGSPLDRDAQAGIDSGTPMGEDGGGGGFDGGVDGGRAPRARDEGCACRAAGAREGDARGGIALGLLVLGAVLVRRRR